MLRRLAGRRALLLAFCCLATLALTITTTTVPNTAAEFTGREILSVTRIAHGGPGYAGLQNVTVQTSGFLKSAGFGGLAFDPLGARAEVKRSNTGFQG